MKIVNTHEAKTHLSRLLKRVAAGETILIAQAGRPIARLAPLEDFAPTREMGFVRHGLHISDDFDAPLPEDLLQTSFGGESS